jgi:hypothetical protein
VKSIVIGIGFEPKDKEAYCQIFGHFRATEKNSGAGTGPAFCRQMVNLPKAKHSDNAFCPKDKQFG